MSETWPEALTVLATAPVGAPGSGRQRYGAAMTLWREGLIAPQVLEVFRIASAVDAQDPAPMLAEAGLPWPGTEIAALLAAATSLIAAMPGPGIAEVGAGLATARSIAPGMRPNAVVAAHLEAALASMPGSDGWSAGQDPAALAAAIRAAAPWLAWVTYDLYPPAEIGPAFGRGHAFAPLACGPEFELGLFLIAPGILYRDRAHAAPDLYLPLTGPHGWRFAPGAALVWQRACVPVWNPPHAPHATMVGRVPFLCFYAWTGDIDVPAYVLPSADWQALEAAT